MPARLGRTVKELGDPGRITYGSASGKAIVDTVIDMRDERFARQPEFAALVASLAAPGRGVAQRSGWDEPTHDERRRSSTTRMFSCGRASRTAKPSRLI